MLFIGDKVKGNGFLEVDDLIYKLRHRHGRWLSKYTQILASIPVE